MCVSDAVGCPKHRRLYQRCRTLLFFTVIASVVVVLTSFFHANLHMYHVYIAGSETYLVFSLFHEGEASDSFSCSSFRTPPAIRLFSPT